MLLNRYPVPYKTLLPIVACFIFLIFSSQIAQAAATFTVININDSGSGSLRQAILDANNTVGVDTIQFNISGSGTRTITPLSALPTITESVIIDGTTQS